MAVLHVITEPDALAPGDAGATMRCQILDTSQADAEAPTVVATVFELTADQLAYNEDGVIQVTVVLDLSADDIVLTPGRDYTVTVHVDHAGDQLYLPGDSITTQSYPLPDGLFAPRGDDHVESIVVALTRI